LLSGPEVGAEVGAAECEERADYVSGDGVDATEACEAGASQDVSENGFSLIVGGVGYGDSGGVPCGDELIEEGVTRSAPSVFEIGFVAFSICGDIGAPSVEGEGMFRGEGGDEFLVGVGSAAAELMIEVGDGEDDAELRAEFQQQVEERDGVGATGDGDGYSIARLEELASADFLQQAG